VRVTGCYLFRNFASRLGFPTHVPQAAAAASPQAAAAARIAGKRDIITAAKYGDISLVGDHITADPSSVNKKDTEYDTAAPNLFFNIQYSLPKICFVFISNFS
jgi:hypothetical protein